VFFPEGPPVRFEFWDGTWVGPDQSQDTVVVATPDALRRLIWSPGELGLGRAYVSGDLELRGDVLSTLRSLEAAASGHSLGWSGLAKAIRAAHDAGALGRPLRAPDEEMRPRGRRHTRRRDARAISHHYDVGNEFYRLFLGPSMTYSCARFTAPETALADAQRSKLDLICRKLGLHEGRPMRLLDVGCGWGSLLIHAAGTYDATAVGITISREQATLARQRVAEAGLNDRIEIRLQDYRELPGERFDAVSSIGMFEHVGSKRMGEYFGILRKLIVPRGRLLNHAISSVGGSKVDRRSFVGRYVFPDGELIDVGDVMLAMESAGFEVRDVESLREHYVRTLQAWIANLDGAWDDAVRLVGPGRARVWRLYFAAAALGFENGDLGVHQVLGVVADQRGTSSMPATRAPCQPAARLVGDSR
jgi:cyclopropane-fatty-acyl-phospholipid synthase